jgi:biopolymer transport protein ExbB
VSGSRLQVLGGAAAGSPPGAAAAESSPLVVVGDWLQALWAQAVQIWTAGGPAMAAIAAVAAVMFGTGVHLHLQLRCAGLRPAAERTWRGWLERPEEASGALRDLLLGAAAASDVREVAARFEQARAAHLAALQRELRVMKTCVGAAPLVGLLGTVTGMLATFGALAAGSGGEQTMDMVSQGIAEALITTETGLVVALPGLLFHYHLTRQRDRCEEFLAHLETACSQRMHRRAHEDRRQRVRRAAAARIARRLHAAVRQPPPAPPVAPEPRTTAAHRRPAAARDSAAARSPVCDTDI